MKKILLCIGIAIAAIGCTKSEITENTPASGEISFSAGVTTRVSADNDCAWASSDDYIGIYTDQTSDTQNLKFSVASNGTMTNQSTTTLMPLEGNAARTYYAYHPYTADQGETISINLTDDYSTPILYATETTNATNVTLQFNHVLAKVSFNLTAGGVDATDLTDATAWITGANTYGEFDLKTGDFTSTTNPDSETLNLTINDDDTIGPLYLIPSTTAAKLWIKANGNTFVKSLDEWVSGEVYEYNITVGEVPPSYSYVEFKRNEESTANITKSDDTGAIESLLSQFRRCLMTSDGNGNATICYLDDSNSTLYDDGTDADLTGKEGDVMVYFPEYWYKYENVDDDNFRYYISESEVDGYIYVAASLVGAYKAYNVSNKVYSRSDVLPTVSVSQANFKSYAAARGTGYQIIDYDQHCTIAMMLYAKYCDRNLQSGNCLGTGGAEPTTTTGSTNSIGNADTTNETSAWVNGLGLEGVYGGICEWIEGVEVNSYEWKITNPAADTTRTITAGSTSGYITSLALESGDYFDMVPTAASGGSYSTYYADYYYCSSSTGRVVYRSYINAYTNGGVSYAYAFYDSSNSGAYIGSRLAFRGTITEAANVEAYKEKIND